MNFDNNSHKYTDDNHEKLKLSDIVLTKINDMIPGNKSRK